MERKPEIVKSITSFPYILNVTLMWKWYDNRIAVLAQAGTAALLLMAVFALRDHRTPAPTHGGGESASAGAPAAGRSTPRRKCIGLMGMSIVLGRPHWATPLQVVPIIFSHALAAEWQRRMRILMDLRLADQKSFAPWSDPASADVPQLSQQGVMPLCGRDDAPAWIPLPGFK